MTEGELREASAKELEAQRAKESESARARESEALRAAELAENERLKVERTAVNREENKTRY